MYKRILQLLLSCLIAVGIEVVFFNLDVIQSTMRDDQILIFEEQDFQYQNWNDKQNTLVSMNDPMIYVLGMNIPVYKMQVELDVKPEISEFTFFYTNDGNESFSAEKMMIVPVNDGKADIQLKSGEKIAAFRIDPGEQAGTILNNIEVRINDIKWHISISRIIAMLIVYWGTIGLMSLQNSPNYGIENIKKEGEIDEA